MSRRTLRPLPSRASAAGVSIVTAIFLLVVLAGLGAAMVNISTSQHISSSADLRGTQAYQAARAGIEWGLFQQLQNNSCQASVTFVPPAPTLKGFSVTVLCTRTATPAAGAGASPAAAVAGTLSNGSSTVSGIADTGIFLEGMRVWGTGIVPGTLIATIDSASTLTLSNPATASGVQQLTYLSAMDRWQIRSTACSEPSAAGLCPNSAPASSDYIQRQLQVDF